MVDNTVARMSDAELIAFRASVEVHMEQDAEWKKTISKNYGDMLKENKERREGVDKEIESINSSLSAIQKHMESIEALARIYNDAQGALRLGVALQRGLLWVAKWGVIGTAAVAAYNFLVDKFGGGGG